MGERENQAPKSLFFVPSKPVPFAPKLPLMKKLAAREAALLTLPVLLLGGGAWWVGRGGKLPQFHNPLDPGPLRVEYTPFQTVQPSPYDVSQGYSWEVMTHDRVLGDIKTPAGWRVIIIGVTQLVVD